MILGGGGGLTGGGEKEGEEFVHGSNMVGQSGGGSGGESNADLPEHHD